MVLSGDGSTLAVGAPYDPSGALGVNADPTDRSRTDAGAVHVFVRSGARWTPQAYLKPANKYAALQFGRVLAVSRAGDTLIVGVPKDSNPKGSSLGSAVVFRRSGATWMEEAYLHPSRGTAEFGTAVALSDDGDTAVVGVPEDTGGQGWDYCESPPCRGAAYVFTRTNGRWTESAILEPPSSLNLPSPVHMAVKMGARVALSGDGTVVGALATGAVATFTRGATWAFEATAPLPGPRYEVDRTIGRGMGSRGYVAPWMSLGMSSDGRTIAVGEPSPPRGGEPFASRVEVFARQDGQLRRTAVVQPLASRPGSNFGSELALSASGTHLAVGAYSDNGGIGGTNPDPCGSTVECRVRCTSSPSTARGRSARSSNRGSSTRTFALESAWRSTGPGRRWRSAPTGTPAAPRGSTVTTRTPQPTPPAQRTYSADSVLVKAPAVRPRGQRSGNGERAIIAALKWRSEGASSTIERAGSLSRTRATSSATAPT